MKDGLHVDGSGIKKWFLNGKLHREGAPAVERPDGTEIWYSLKMTAQRLANRNFVAVSQNSWLAYP